MYANAVATVFHYILIYPPLFLLAYLGFGRRRKKRKDRAEVRARALGIGAVIMLTGSAIVAYNLLNSGSQQRLATWQIISIIVAISIIALMERRLVEHDIDEKSRAGNAETTHFPTRVTYVSIVFSLLLLVTISFLLITRPNTVNGASRILDGNGRYDTTFLRHDPPETEFLPDGAGPLGAYAFSDIGGRNVWVDVVSGRILE